MLSVWTFGAPMIIFLAGLRQVPKELYEAAAVDGAGRDPAVLQRDAAVALPAHLLQRAADHRERPPGIHPGVRGEQRHGRPGGLHAVLHPLPLPAGLHPARHGLRGGDGVGPRSRSRRLHRPSCSQRPGSGSITETSDEHICPHGQDPCSRGRPDLPRRPSRSRLVRGVAATSCSSSFSSWCSTPCCGWSAPRSVRPTRRSTRSASGRAASHWTTTRPVGATVRCSSPGTS